MNLACIGTGRIVESFLSACKQNERISLYGVYSRTFENGLKIAEKFNIQLVYIDLNEMLNDENIDIVYIASPNSLHYEQCIQCIKAKKHVIVEKPFTSNVREARDIFVLAENNSVFVFEAMSLRFLPNLTLLKEKIRDIGVVNWLETTCISLSSRYIELMNGKEPNVFSLTYSGGALMDLNIYNLTFVYEIFGKPLSVYYLFHRYKNGIDLSGVLTMQYPDFIAVCVAAKNSNGKNSATIYGSNGLIEINNGVNGLSGFNLVIGEDKSHHNIQSEMNHFTYEVNEMISIIKDRKIEEYSKITKHTIDVMEIITGARYKSGLMFDCDLNHI